MLQVQSALNEAANEAAEISEETQRTPEEIFEGLKLARQQEAEGALMDAILAGNIETTSERIWILTYLQLRYEHELAKELSNPKLEDLISREIYLIKEELEPLKLRERRGEPPIVNQKTPKGSGDLSREYFLRVIDEEMDKAALVARLMGDRPDSFKDSESTKALVNNISLVL